MGLVLFLDSLGVRYGRQGIDGLTGHGRTASLPAGTALPVCVGACLLSIEVLGIGPGDVADTFAGSMTSTAAARKAAIAPTGPALSTPASC